jgi:hypothetical protein
MYIVGVATSQMTLTHFLRHSGPALEQVDSRDLRLQRRDGEDLYLKRADREEAEHESLAAAGRLLVRVLQMQNTSEALLELVEDALPWSRFLPDRDRVQFVTEFVRTIEASADLDNFVPVGTVLKQWRATADVWADPVLRAALEADIEEGAVVERPTEVG